MEKELYEHLKRIANSKTVTELMLLKCEAEKICESYEEINNGPIYEEFAPEGVLIPKEM